jgi:hypothetical protein
MLPTPIPYPTITTLADVGTYHNSTTGGAFGIVVLFVIWTVSFFALSTWPKPQAFAGASWLSLIVAIILQTAGWIDWFVTGGAFAMAALSVAWLLNS